MRDWEFADWVIAVIAVLVLGGIAFLIYAVANEEPPQDKFMRACQKIGKSEAQCEYEWLLRPSDGGTTPVVIPMPVYSGR